MKPAMPRYRKPAPEPSFGSTENYFHVVYRRTNILADGLLHIMQMLLSWPCLIVEVFLRSHMGRRHFSMVSAILAFALLIVIPVVVARMGSMGYYGGGGFGYILGKNATWYAFALAFLGFSFYRRKEIGSKTSEYDYGHFSLSSGESLPLFDRLENYGLKVNPRRTAIFYEPAVFLIAGLLLAVMGQAVGLLLMFCGLCYSWNNVLAYRRGDDFILDKIDEAICKEELAANFLGEKKASQSRGFNFYGFRPGNPDLRRKIVDSFSDDDAVEAY